MIDSIESNISLEQYARTLVFDILQLEELEIPLDRTNWQRGEIDINYFMLSVLWNGVAIPLYWQLLDNNGGSSNNEQRIGMIKWIIDVFGADKVKMVYADREFPSYEFLDYLIHDSRYCQSYLEPALSEELITTISKYQTVANQLFQVPASVLTNLALNDELTIIDTNAQLFLAQKLQTNEYTIYPLIFPNQYRNIKRQLIAQLPKLKIGVALLASFFRGFTHKATINFVARCKSSTAVSYGKETITLAALYHDLHLKRFKTEIATDIKRAFGNRLFISARLNIENEFVFVISNIQLQDPFTTYKKRWNIELMFGKFKTLGFNLESTHITKHSRLSALMMLISIAYTCCCKIGKFFEQHIKPIKTKPLVCTDGVNKENRLQFSIFRVGFNLLKNFINNQLFAGAAASQLLHKILDYDPNNPTTINKRSKIFKLIQRF